MYKFIEMAAVSVTHVDDQTHARKIGTNVSSKSSKIWTFWTQLGQEFEVS